MSLFEQNIQSINFPFLASARGSGVVLTRGYESFDPCSSIASPDILFALETAKDKFDADAVYFRYFPDGRGVMPQIYLFDYTGKAITNEEKKKIQIKMWNGHQVPAYIIVEKSEISIYDSREKPSEDKDRYAEEIIHLTSDTFNTFRSQSFDDGLFWESHTNKSHFLFEQSATRDLIRGLKEVYADFQKVSGLDRHVALKLLVQSLLVKYLEERDEKSISGGYFASTYFKRNFQCDNFCDTIRKGKLLDLLDQLSKDFNGKIFAWDTESEVDARVAIRKTEVVKLADYLDANNQDGQYVLWRLYSFSHLPVEIISSVYEELLTDSKDIVYTPEMIVSTLIDECMPLTKPCERFKLIDVSCGSGIFLVKAYKRLVQWWRYENWLKTGELVKPSLSVLKELLTKNIYGVDIEQDAVRLSIFSLALAMLDEVNLDPPTWGKLKFPDLSDNIITKNFFEYITSDYDSDFDLVIGNPPFNLPPINNKEPNRTEYFTALKKCTGYKSEIKIPDENPALHFLVQSIKLLKQDAVLCLIQPSGPLLYQKDVEFKQSVYGCYNLLQVIDFTKLANVLWGRKNVSTAAVFIQKSTPDNRNVLHLIANKTFANSNRLFLEFDHYDFHMIPKEDSVNQLYAWKSNLLGGGRISQLIGRLSKLRTLGEYLEDKISNGWIKGEGFIKGGNTSAPYITEKDFLPTESFTEDGIDVSIIIKCEFKHFHRPRREPLYQPPHLLIRKILGKNKLITQYVDKYLTFQSDIFAIHAPTNDKQELVNIDRYLDDYGSLLRFYILATSSRVGVGKATSLYDEDILSLPYPEDLSEVKLSKAEEILLNDALEFELSGGERKMFVQLSRIDDLLAYSDILCKTLNTIYSNGKTFQLFKVLDAIDYYALHFEYTSDDITTKTETVSDLNNYISNIIPNHKKARDSTHIQKIMKIYGKDSIVLVKPKQIRYWLKSTSLRDADEIFADYIKSRYGNA